MFKLTKILAVTILILPLGCATLSTIGDTVCRALIGGSVVEVACDEIRDAVQPEVEETDG